jgi:hypothetical protein
LIILLPWVLVIFIFIFIFIITSNSYLSINFILEVALPELLKTLCKGNVRKNLEQHQALTRLLAEILDFSFEFDYSKVVEFIYFKNGEKNYSNSH